MIVHTPEAHRRGPGQSEDVEDVDEVDEAVELDELDESDEVDDVELVVEELEWELEDDLLELDEERESFL